MVKNKSFNDPRCMRCDSILEMDNSFEDEDCVAFRCPNCGTIEIVTLCDDEEKENYAFYNESIDDELGKTEHGYHGLCPQCNSHIIWGADFMRSEVIGDVDNDKDDSLASSVSCPCCGANIQIIDAKPSEYRNYPAYGYESGGTY